MQFSSVEKQRVPENFDEVAPTYDLLTTLNPGYHRHLRLSAERLEVRPEARILDLCCGTGASTEALVSVHPRARIEGLDASAGMLVAARKKPILRGIPFLQGDATDPRTHGANGLYDGILMAYGIRNVPDPDRCLSNLLSLLSSWRHGVLSRVLGEGLAARHPALGCGRVGHHHPERRAHRAAEPDLPLPAPERS
jgi:ubiquinone/menaquinone biosynthesis C-methylase UbiE